MFSHGGAARVLGGDGDPIVGVHLVRLRLAQLAVVGNDLHGILVGATNRHLVSAAYRIVLEAPLLVLIQNINLLKQQSLMLLLSIFVTMIWEW